MTLGAMDLDQFIVTRVLKTKQNKTKTNKQRNKKTAKMSSIPSWPVADHPHITVNTSVVPLKRVLHLLPKISMFCALSQNNQQLFENILCILSEITQGTQKWH